MNTIEKYWKRYKWYIIGYIIYVCFISSVVSTEYRWHKNEYWDLWIVWCIMLPLITYCIISFIIYLRNKKGEKN